MQHNDHTTPAGEYDPPASAAEIYTDLEAWGGVHHDLQDEDVHVTRHVQQKFLERVTGSEPYPRSRIEREFREAHPVDINDPDITEPTRLHPKSGAVYVFDPEDCAVLTCFIPTEEQLGNANSAAPGGRAII